MLAAAAFVPKPDITPPPAVNSISLPVVTHTRVDGATAPHSPVSANTTSADEAAPFPILPKPTASARHGSPTGIFTPTHTHTHVKPVPRLMRMGPSIIGCGSQGLSRSQCLTSLLCTATATASAWPQQDHTTRAGTPPPFLFPLKLT